MNERIKELWVQGTQTVVPREGDYSSVSAKNIEKFAELIVRECSKFAEQYIDERCDRDFGVSVNMRKHFGVEE